MVELYEFATRQVEKALDYFPQFLHFQFNVFMAVKRQNYIFMIMYIACYFNGLLLKFFVYFGLVFRVRCFSFISGVCATTFVLNNQNETYRQE